MLGMAEGVGFEPTDGASPSLDFESSPFDHSGIPPRANLAGRSAPGKRWSVPRPAKAYLSDRLAAQRARAEVAQPNRDQAEKYRHNDIGTGPKPLTAPC